MQQAAELSVAAPTITASLDGRYMSACKEERVEAAKFYEKLGLKVRASGGSQREEGKQCACRLGERGAGRGRRVKGWGRAGRPRHV